MSPTASERPPARPATLDGASAVVAAAAAEGRTLRVGEDLVLDRMARVLHHEPGDLTVAVEAGIRLSELSVALGGHGQRLSLDPPGDPTIGACVAGALSGPLRHRFGAPRDLVLGVTLVLGDGLVASSGGTVVKNVAGYDLARLACGSRGRFGLIARVALRLHPLPPRSATVVVETDAAAAVVAAIERSQLQPSALDVLHPGRVALLFEGSAAGVDAQVTAARALVGGEETDPSIWDEARARQAAAPGRVGFAPGELGSLLPRWREAVVRPSVGVAYVDEPVSAEADPVRVALLERLQAQLDPHGVYAAVDAGEGRPC